jgi:large subunit ribosomal protein L30
VTRVVLESFRLNAALLAIGEPRTREFGTTGARWTVLSELQLAGEPRTVARIARALGLKRIRHTVVHEDTPVIRGMVNKVAYLVEVRPAAKKS